MSRTKQPREPLSELEQMFMDFIWERGPSTAEDVRLGMRERRALKDSTVRTVLRRMEAKGYVRHEIDGRSYRYCSTVGRSSAATAAVGRLVDRFFEGSVEQMLLGLVENEVVDENELARLARKVADAKKSEKRRKS